MTLDLITALQTHGQQHKGTDLGGVLQWAILHIQSQNEAIEELRADFEEEHDERLRFEKAAHYAKAAIDAALDQINETMPAPPLDFATDHTSHINLMGGLGDPDYMKGSLSSRHIDTHYAKPAAPVVLPEPGINTASHAGFRVIGYTEQQVRELLAKATCTKSQTQEPFGYFKAEPFGWRDCAETDEGAIALYEAPQPQADARAVERVDALYTALEVCSAELFAQCAHQGRAMKYVAQARKALAAEQCARAANAAAKENK